MNTRLKDIHSQSVSTPYCYVLCFTDGTMYVGSAVSVFRLYRYKTISAAPTQIIESTLNKALKTFDCLVEITPCISIEEARTVEKTIYELLKKDRIFLHNINEGGQVHGKRDKELLKQKKNLDPSFLYSNGASKTSVLKAFNSALATNKPLKLVGKLLDHELLELLKHNAELRNVVGASRCSKNKMKKVHAELIRLEILEKFKDW